MPHEDSPPDYARPRLLSRGHFFILFQNALSGEDINHLSGAIRGWCLADHLDQHVPLLFL
jgi:hypothetical protein